MRLSFNFSVERILRIQRDARRVHLGLCADRRVCVDTDENWQRTRWCCDVSIAPNARTIRGAILNTYKPHRLEHFIRSIYVHFFLANVSVIVNCSAFHRRATFFFASSLFNMRQKHGFAHILRDAPHERNLRL